MCEIGKSQGVRRSSSTSIRPVIETVATFGFSKLRIALYGLKVVFLVKVYYKLQYKCVKHGNRTVCDARRQPVWGPRSKLLQSLGSVS